MPRFRIPRLAIPIVACVVLVVAFLFLADPLFDLDIGLVVDRSTSVSNVVALAGRDLMLLNTLESVYKVVFPYDFVPQEVNWKLFNEQVASGRVLSLEEERYLEVYRLAEAIGFELASKRTDFVVVTAIVKIGLDLERFSAYTRTVVNGEVGPVTIRSDGSVVVALPRAIITDLIIEDSTSEGYRYPDIVISPEGWRRLSGFISESVRERIAESELFLRAEQQARRFLTAFFAEAGYKSVIFVE